MQRDYASRMIRATLPVGRSWMWLSAKGIAVRSPWKGRPGNYETGRVNAAVGRSRLEV